MTDSCLAYGRLSKKRGLLFFFPHDLRDVEVHAAAVLRRLCFDLAELVQQVRSWQNQVFTSTPLCIEVRGRLAYLVLFLFVLARSLLAFLNTFGGVSERPRWTEVFLADIAGEVAFSVFPSAVLLGAPAGPTRVISIAAYQAAFEEYDYSMASAVAMIMGLVQLAIVVAVLGLRGMLYRGPAGGGKG